ncbi:MAG TPA: DUF302 domain-containing protein [Thiobacillus sp.]
MRLFRLPALALLMSALLLPVTSSQADVSPPKTLSQVGIYKVAIDRNVSMSDAADSMRLRANSLNLQLVAELPLSKQVEAVTGKPQRTITIFQFCDAVTAKDLIDVNPEFSVFMPCRIALIEDPKGQGWLVMMDVDVNAVATTMKLTPVLKARVNEVRNSLIEIMQAGAKGDL